MSIYTVLRHVPIENIIGFYTDLKITHGTYILVVSPFSDSGNNSMNHMRINRKKNTWFDYAISEGGDAVEFVSKLFNLSNYAAAQKILKDQPDILKGIKINEKLPKFVDDTKRESLELHLAYKVFLTICKLSKQDYLVLRKERHLSDSEIKFYNLFTMPYPNKANRTKLVRQLNKFELTKEIFHYVPGFYELNGELHWKFISGIGIPSIDYNHHITGIQIRLRNPKKDMPRYLWFSSSSVRNENSKYGHGSGTPISIVRYCNPEKNVYVEPSTSKFVITEGFFKAIQYSKLEHCHVAALAGVGNFNGIDKAIKTMVSNNEFPSKQPEIVIGYDADSLINPQVLQQEYRLYDYISKLGYPVKVLYWDVKEGKGFDDLVFAHPRDFAKYLHLVDWNEFQKMTNKMLKK